MWDSMAGMSKAVHPPPCSWDTLLKVQPPGQHIVRKPTVVCADSMEREVAGQPLSDAEVCETPSRDRAPEPQ